MAYQLYRVNGDFKTSLDFREFPFDEQRLPITVQNRSLPTGRVVYAVDPDVTVQPQQERLRSGLNDSLSVLEVPNWRADSLIFFQGSIGNTSVLGDPSIEAGLGGVTYSQAATQLQISRDVRSFLVKNVLPLALLGIVLYITLWMPYSDATSRISFGVTGILTGAVMLNSVTSSLPTVSYAVAIEWAYYFETPPFGVEPKSAEAVRWASVFGTFHWGRPDGPFTACPHWQLAMLTIAAKYAASA